MTRLDATKKITVLTGATCALVLGYWIAFSEIFFIWDGWAWKLCSAEWAKDPALLWSLDPSYSFRPLCRVLYLLMHLCFGDQAVLYLLVILGLHLAAAITAGKLIQRVTSDQAAGLWTLLLFCAMSSFTEAIQWIGAFPHVLLGFEVLLFLLLVAPESQVGSSASTSQSPSMNHKPKTRLLFALIVLIIAVFTREPWVVSAPLLVVVLFWKGGWKGVFGRRGLLLCSGMAACVLLYFYIFNDILHGERVPGGLDLMGFGFDSVPRILRSLTLLFVPNLFYADILRSTTGGIAIIGSILVLSSLGGKQAFRNAVMALLFVLAALIPFSFYRAEFICGRYFYLAGVGAAYLIYLSCRGAGAGLMRLKLSGSAATLLVTLALIGWSVLSIISIREETRQVYHRAWTQSRCAAEALPEECKHLKEGEFICILNLPDQNPAIWETMANYLCHDGRAEFLLASDPKRLLEMIESRTQAPDKVRYLFWTGKSNYKAELVPYSTREAIRMIHALEPKRVWGWPGDSMPKKVGALLLRKNG